MCLYGLRAYISNKAILIENSFIFLTKNLNIGIIINRLPKQLKLC
jgi:hypothetical protein